MKRLVTLVIIALILAGAAYGGYTYLIESNRAAASQAKLNTVTVQKGNIVASVSTTGSLVPVNQVRLTFGVADRIKEINVKVGDRVKAGTVLARLDTADLELRLAQAQYTLETNQIKLAQAQAGLKADEVKIAKVALEKAAIALQKAQTDYDRIAWRSDIASTPQAIALQQATLDYESALANYSLKTAGSTEQDLKILENNVKNSQAAYDLARLALQDAVIVAPFDGVVAAVNGNPGEQVSTAREVIYLIDPIHVRLDANVDEMDVGKVAVGQEAVVTLDALPDRKLRGRVQAIAPSSSVQAGVVTYQVQIAIENTDSQVRFGMTANAQIITDRHDNVLVVPNRAIRLVNRTRRIVQVVVNGAPQEKEVRTGLSSDQMTEILEGLTEGDQVVIPTTATNNPLRGTNLFGAPGK